MALKQGLKLKLQHQLSQDQIQLMQLLEIPLINLEQRIKEEIEENPALELEDSDFIDDSLEPAASESETEDIPDEVGESDIDWDTYMNDGADEYDYDAYSGFNQEEDFVSSPVKFEESFIESLERQIDLQEITDRQKAFANHIIASLDEDGYLSRDLQGMSYDLAFSGIEVSVAELEDVLSIVQDLEPAGIGARDLRECLLLQLYRKRSEKYTLIATDIIENYFDAYSKKHFDKILKKFSITEEEYKKVDEVIHKLNPKPGKAIGGGSAPETLIPDFFITQEDGKLVLRMEHAQLPELRISGGFRDLMKAKQEAAKQSKDEKDALKFINTKVKAAEIFIENIRQRYNTLYAVMDCILQEQYDFFLTGDIRQLKPMILEDIAEQVELNISTISRVSRSKYVQTDFGVYALKQFFSESITNDEGEEVSTSAIKDIVKNLIESEDKRKPLSDQSLQELLEEKGYPIARRTVAKYRNQLGLAVAGKRKEL